MEIDDDDFSPEKPKRPVSKRAEISRRYYVKKSLLKGKIPKKLTPDDVKNDKLTKLNEVLERLKKKKEPEPEYDEEEDEDDEDEEDDEEDEDDIPVVKKVDNELMDKLDAIIDMLMFLIKKEEEREPPVSVNRKPVFVNIDNKPAKLTFL